VLMNQKRLLRQLAGLIALFLTASALAQQAKTLDEVMSYDGLRKIDIKGIDTAYALSGATLAGYKTVMIQPIGVRFHKSWKPTVRATGAACLPASCRTFATMSPRVFATPSWKS